jgi:alkylation response protein AidB-like acyl-CoA dehydrogenase
MSADHGPLVLPDVQVPAGAAALRGDVRAFLDGQEFEPRCDSWATAWGWSPEFSRALGDRGWIGMTWPRRYGGQERSALERFVVIEELLAAGAPVSAHWVADRQSGPSILRFGTDDQRERLLPAMARGACSFAIGMSEEGSGSDLASVTTRADAAPGGLTLSGTKKWTGGAHRAPYAIVLCRTAPPGKDRHAGLSQLIVDLRADGVSMRPIRLMHGVHQWNEVTFDEVFVPDDMVLGELGAGWSQVTAELAQERSGPERVLSTYPLLEAFAAAARPDDDPRVLAALGSLVADLTVLRRLSLAVAGALDHQLPVDVPAALVKDLGTRFERRVVEAVRGARPFLRGGSGPDLDRLLGEALLSTPGFTLRGGTTEILRGIVARALVAGELSPPPPSAPAGSSADLPENARLVAQAADGALALSLLHARERVQFGRPLARFQAIQQHLAVLAGEAVACRAAARAAEGDELAQALAKVRSAQAAGEVARLAHQVHGAVGYSDEHPLHRFTRALWDLRDEHGTEHEWAARAGERLAGPGLWERLTADG